MAESKRRDIFEIRKFEYEGDDIHELNTFELSDGVLTYSESNGFDAAYFTTEFSLVEAEMIRDFLDRVLPRKKS